VGYTGFGALKNVGHRVGRSTIARMLKAYGFAGSSYHVVARFCGRIGVISVGDFFTTEVWTWRGL
jgi:hypothetical protein